MSKIRNIGKLVGGIGGVASILLWILLSFFNPYDSQVDFEPIKNTFFMLFLPASLALISTLTSERWLMLLAFIWSLPLSLYFILTPGIFLLFGVTCIAYLISYVCMILPMKKK